MIKEIKFRYYHIMFKLHYEDALMYRKEYFLLSDTGFKKRIVKLDKKINYHVEKACFYGNEMLKIIS